MAKITLNDMVRASKYFDGDIFLSRVIRPKGENDVVVYYTVSLIESLKSIKAGAGVSVQVDVFDDDESFDLVFEYEKKDSPMLHDELDRESVKLANALFCAVEDDSFAPIAEWMADPAKYQEDVPSTWLVMDKIAWNEYRDSQMILTSNPTYQGFDVSVSGAPSTALSELVFRMADSICAETRLVELEQKMENK